MERWTVEDKKNARQEEKMGEDEGEGNAGRDMTFLDMNEEMMVKRHTEKVVRRLHTNSVSLVFPAQLLTIPYTSNKNKGNKNSGDVCRGMHDANKQ